MRCPQLLRRFVGVMPIVSRFWLWIKEYDNIRKVLSWGIVVLFILFILVMLLPPAECIYMYFTGTKTKFEILKFIGWGMSGLIATLGVIGLLQRAAALDVQNKLTETGHVHERFKAATEHLGNERASMRIAAFYEFCHLAEIAPDLRKPIFDILCAHLRQTTKDKNYQNEEIELNMILPKEIKPTEEIQSLLYILFRPLNKNDLIFGSMYADLRGASLQRANLRSAYLKGAKLKKAYLQKAYLRGANLEEAHLKEAKLQEANLQKVNLQKVNLQRANLQGANLQEANLQKANMQKVNLQGANLQRANLLNVYLQGAKINKNTTMPDDWKNMVKKDDNGKTGVLVVDDKKEIIERL